MYDKLHKIYPDVVYVFDVFQVAEIIDNCISSNEVTKEEWFRFEAKKKQIESTLKILEEKESTWKEAEASCKSVINFLLQDGKRRELDEFKKNMELIMREQPDFIYDFFKIKEYHVFLPNELQNTMEDFLKSRGYNSQRLVYMILSRAREVQKEEALNQIETQKLDRLQLDYMIDGSAIVESQVSEVISSINGWAERLKHYCEHIKANS